MRQDNSWTKDDINSAALKVVLFLISPFISLLYSIKTLNTKSTYRVIYFFCLCFGVCFTVNKIRGNIDFDGVTYRNLFESYINRPSSFFYTELTEYLKFDSGLQDIYSDLFAFIVSRFTDNYHIYFLVFASVFAFFQLRALRYFSSSHNWKLNLCGAILLFYFLYNQIFNINGVRFWTAAWIAVYSMFKIYRDGEQKYYLLALTTPLVHGAYWGVVAILLIAFLRKYENLWKWAFFGSIFIGSIMVSLVSAQASFLPSFLSNKLVIYVERVNEESVGTGYYWLVPLFDTIGMLYTNLLVFIIIINRKIITKNNRSIFRFLLVWMTMVNFIMAIPAMGGRFIVLAYSIIAYLWLEMFGTHRYRWIIYLLPIAFSLQIYLLIQMYFMVIQPEFFIESPIFMLSNLFTVE